MAKSKIVYVCDNCGYSQVGWSGKCPQCNKWGSLVETLSESPNTSSSSKLKNINVKPQSLSEIKLAQINRIKTNIPELDRVLGGGFVPGQIVLLAGEPGIGKSTILLEVCQKLGNSFYASGEESALQIKIRAERLKLDGKNISLLEETNIDNIISSIQSENSQNKVNFAVIDSIQTMRTDDLSGMSGSVGQVRESTYRLVRMSKTLNIPTVVVGHVTKEGTVGGPALLAHLVDTVLWFEGEKDSQLRVIRAYKNRFGPTDETGMFEMKDSGLVSISDPSKVFQSGVGDGVAGVARSVIMQGTRPVIIEIQSLISKSSFPLPRRVAQGIDAKRLELILAVLSRRCGIDLSTFDVYVNAVGGINVKDPAVDLAVALSLASSKFDKPLPKFSVSAGEVGLLGEIRPVFSQEKRLKEAKSLGYKIVFSPSKFQFLPMAIKEIFSK